MKRVSVLGHFGFGKILLNGQTIKTKIVTDELERRIPNEILKIDTHGGVKTLFKSPFQVFKSLKESENVVIFPAHNGLRIYAPLLVAARKFFKGRKLHYVVIGGWLPEYVKEHSLLQKALKKFDFIYVETTTMKKALECLGFENIVIMPNCKKLTVLSEENLVYADGEPYKLCTFSRVMREKGIEDAVAAVKIINEKLGKTVYTLDIYGPVDSGQTEWFESLKIDFPDYVTYKGAIDFDKSVEVLKDYFALLFPTRFYTEGIPGTIIDGYAAGIPVISSKWESFSDVIDEGITGYGYEFGNVEALETVLYECCVHTDKILKIKINCLRQGKSFLTESAVDILIKRLEDL